MRLVPNQTSADITSLFENHFKKIAPSSVKDKVTPHHGGEGVVIPTDFKGYLAAKNAMNKLLELIQYLLEVEVVFLLSLCLKKYWG